MRRLTKADAQSVAELPKTSPEAVESETRFIRRVIEMVRRGHRVEVLEEKRTGQLIAIQHVKHTQYSTPDQ